MSAYLVRLAVIVALITPLTAYAIYTSENALDSPNIRLAIATAVATLALVAAIIVAILPRA